ncbi:hypothetical protein RHMOL_Rhmol02G0262300 [Rhododendron molle]|uniref:Uncharacterized protein n=1 Tax=Rhododendron molle TaxID=49168 RepID=A0ACC0PVR1_RHOML|nr:hypothetical protein RHMOL_Rhmol02G0262300 [Rhododendron molle]
MPPGGEAASTLLPLASLPSLLVSSFAGVRVWPKGCGGFTVAGVLFNCFWGLRLGGLTVVGWCVAVVSPCFCFVLSGEELCRSGVVGSR